jgi:hypothetical protein
LIVSTSYLNIFQIHGLQFQHFFDSCAKAVAELKVMQVIAGYRFLSLLGYVSTSVLDVAIVVQEVHFTDLFLYWQQNVTSNLVCFMLDVSIKCGMVDHHIT